MRRTAIPNSQTPLQRRSRSAAHLAADAHGVLVKLVVRFFAAAVWRTFKTLFHLAVFILRCFQQLFVVLCLCLLPPEIADVRNLVFRDKRSVNAVQPRRSR